MWPAKRYPSGYFDYSFVYVSTSKSGDFLICCAYVQAVKQMIRWLGETKGLSAVDAYMLCSCAGDLKISEVVDQPNWVVSFHMPLAVFV